MGRVCSGIEVGEEGGDVESGAGWQLAMQPRSEDEINLYLDSNSLQLQLSSGQSDRERRIFDTCLGVSPAGSDVDGAFGSSGVVVEACDGWRDGGGKEVGPDAGSDGGDEVEHEIAVGWGEIREFQEGRAPRLLVRVGRSHGEDERSTVVRGLGWRWGGETRGVGGAREQHRRSLFAGVRYEDFSFVVGTAICDWIKQTVILGKSLECVHLSCIVRMVGHILGKSTPLMC
ncbi:hypothetical protein ACLOJK_016528 [Asimina triloba]